MTVHIAVIEAASWVKHIKLLRFTADVPGAVSPMEYGAHR
jgi:hypothetical protein